MGSLKNLSSPTARVTRNGDDFTIQQKKLSLVILSTLKLVILCLLILDYLIV